MMTSKVINPDHGHRRLHLRICRIVAIMEVLHQEKQGATLLQIHDAVNDLLPRKVCDRTIRRDLEALAFMGFAEVEVIKFRNGAKLHRYHLASPVMLRNRLLKAGRGHDF